MPLQTDSLRFTHLDLSQHGEPLLERARKHLDVAVPRFQRLWNYYRNPIGPAHVGIEDLGSCRPYRQAQEWGLPARITGLRQRAARLDLADGVARKEVVIENDIAWRVDSMIDAIFGKPIELRSTAPDPARCALLERLLRATLSRNGGLLLLQQLALLGAVHGFVDVLVKFTPPAPMPLSLDTLPAHSNAAPAQRDAALLGEAASTTDHNLSTAAASEVVTIPDAEASGASSSPVTGDDAPRPREESVLPGTNSGSSDAPTFVRTFEDAADVNRASIDAAIDLLASCIRFEVVEASRALPLLSPADGSVAEAYAQVYALPRPARTEPRRPRAWAKLFGLDTTRDHNEDRAAVIELITPDRWQRYEDEQLVAEGMNSLGRLPLVHIQNSAIPFEYAGGSDVEPLMPLQDELNTRLSDRACRITMQSFKMYLGKGLDDFVNLPISPGRMWSTDNLGAQVVEFGGDSACPSEESHIADIREALDKTSGISPVAAGAIRGRIGNLTSAAALRITMQAMLARTERRRTTYGPAIAQLCELALAWLDRAKLLSTSVAERGIEIVWPDPLASTSDLRPSDFVSPSTSSSAAHPAAD